jgi:putative FmdB family regulatory protein
VARLFDYECLVCSNIFEAFEIPNSEATPHCPACHSLETERKFPVPKIGGETPYKTLDKYGIPEPKVTSGPYWRSK